MTIWYRVDRYKRAEIAPVVVVKTTEKTITTIGYGGRHDRQAINSSWYNYYPSFEEARQEQIRRCEADIKFAYEKINDAESALDKLRGMQETPKHQPSEDE